MPGVFPDYKEPIVRNGAEGRELVTARWGMPSSQHALMEATKKRAANLEAKGKPVDFKELLRMEPDGGTTNIRNVKSKHWTRWLGAENRCVVPFNSFSEFNKAEGGDIWFALDETRPLACFAGIWTNWTSVRKVKEGKTTNDVYAFLTTEANAKVGAIHPKAMPGILTWPDEVETWMTAPADGASTEGSSQTRSSTLNFTADLLQRRSRGTIARLPVEVSGNWKGSGHEESRIGVSDRCD